MELFSEEEKKRTKKTLQKEKDYDLYDNKKQKQDTDIKKDVDTSVLKKQITKEILEQIKVTQEPRDSYCKNRIYDFLTEKLLEIVNNPQLVEEKLQSFTEEEMCEKFFEKYVQGGEKKKSKKTKKIKKSRKLNEEKDIIRETIRQTEKDKLKALAAC